MSKYKVTLIGSSQITRYVEAESFDDAYDKGDALADETIRKEIAQNILDGRFELEVGDVNIELQDA